MFARKTISALLAGSVAIGGVTGVQAQTAASLTTAGTRIDNTATVTYTVNGSSNSTNSTTASFVVDKKANFTVVADQTGLTAVNLGDTAAVTRFKVTNLTNDVQDFLLAAGQALPIGIFPNAANFTVSNLQIFVDSNNNGQYDPGVDTKTYIDELAPDASVNVFVIGDVPNQQNAQYAYDALAVTVAAGGAQNVKGTALVATDLGLINNDNTVDIVFADQTRTGTETAYSGWEVSTHNVALTVAKTARVLSDGYSLLGKAIPGATVEYCLTVRNATLLTSATNVVLTDILPSTVTYVPGTVTIGVPGVLGVACNVGGVTQTDASVFNSTTKTITATIPTVGGGTSTAVAFQVKIN